MRAVVQRVSAASVDVAGRHVSSIGQGLLVLVGISPEVGDAEAAWLAGKLIGLRIFSDDADKMNLSVEDVGGEVLLVSQFTLYGDARKGRRPSFIRAARGPEAQALYERISLRVNDAGVACRTGEFGAMMQVSLVNDGPVTILLDSEKAF